MDLFKAKKNIDGTLESYTLEKAKNFWKGFAISVPVTAAVGVASGFVIKAITHDDEKAMRVAYIVAGSGETLFLLYKGLIKDSTPSNCNYERLKEMKADIERGCFNPLENISEEQFRALYPIPAQKQKRKGLWPLKKGCN